MTTVVDRHGSSFSGSLNSDSESNLDPVSSPEVATSPSAWTDTELQSSAGITIPSVEASVKTPIREVHPSTFPLETEYHAPRSVILSLQEN